MNEEVKLPKHIRIGLNIFYILIALVIVGGGLYFWNEKQSFYLMEKNIQIPLNANYTISLIGKTELKDSDDFEYTSSDTSVASVDSFGVIHAKGSGEAKINIKAKYGINNQVLDVVVGDDELYLIEFDNDNILMKQKENYTLKPLINGESDYKTDLVYTSSNNKIISVDEKGKCTANDVGTAYVEVKLKGTEYGSKIRITVNKAEEKQETKKQETKKQETKKQETKKQETKSTTVIEESTSASEEIVNTHVYVNEVTLSSSKSKIKVGESIQLNYNIVPSNATNKKITFSSSNESVASVSKTGLVKGLKAGKTSIVVKTDESKKTAFIDLEVENNTIYVSSISMNKTQTSLLEGDQEKLYVNFNPSNSTNQSVTWSSSDSSIVSVDNSGNIVANKVGTAIIKAVSVDGNKEASCNVNVQQKPIPVTAINVDKTKLSLKSGESGKVTASIVPSNATNQSLVWNSENTKIVTVDGKGNIKAVGAGSTKVVVKTSDGTIKNEISVTVNEILITEISLSGNSELTKDKTDQICLTYKPSNATDNLITWSSSNTNIITVDKKGNVKGIGYGSATITATNKKSGKKATIKITVIPTKKLLDIRNGKYTKLASFQTWGEDSYQHMQGFAISNLGKDNQIIYVVGPTKGVYPTSATSLNAAEKANLTRTIVYRVKKADINDPNARARMYLENSGHGCIDIEGDSDIVWTNAYGVKPDAASSDGWWGKSVGVMRIKFQSIAKGASFTPLVKFKITDDSGKEFTNGAPSIDKENDLIMMHAGLNAWIYKFSDFQKGKKTLIYKVKLNSTLPSKENGTSLANQGAVLKDGYIYQIRGFAKTNNYIEAFDLTGKSIYKKQVGTIANNTEPEGIKIYNNRIYFGVMGANSTYEIGSYNSTATLNATSAKKCTINYKTE